MDKGAREMSLKTYKNHFLFATGTQRPFFLISISGGFTERASRSKIFVVHDSGDGAQQRHEDDEKKQVKLFDVIQPGDVITIDQSFF